MLRSSADASASDADLPISDMRARASRTAASSPTIAAQGAHASSNVRSFFAVSHLRKRLSQLVG
jgi:hypothetical protein